MKSMAASTRGLRRLPGLMKRTLTSFSGSTFATSTSCSECRPRDVRRQAYYSYFFHGLSLV